MNNDSLLHFAPYLFLLESDSTYYLNYWISVPEGFKAASPTNQNDPTTGTKLITIQIEESSGNPAEILKVKMDPLTDAEGLTQVKVLVEYPEGGNQQEKFSILQLSQADSTPVSEPGAEEGILPYKPYGYWTRNAETDTYSFHYLFYTPVKRNLHSPSKEPSEGDKFFLGYILDVPQGEEGVLYTGHTEVPTINLMGDPYTYLDTYVATLEAGVEDGHHLGQPSTAGSVIFTYNDAD